MSPEITNFLKEKKISMEFLSVDLKPTLFIKKKIYSYMRGAKRARKLRKFLYQSHLLALVSLFCPIWTFRRKYEINALNSNVFLFILLYFHSSKSTKKNIKHLYPFRWIILKCTIPHCMHQRRQLSSLPCTITVYHSVPS